MSDIQLSRVSASTAAPAAHPNPVPPAAKSASAATPAASVDLSAAAQKLLDRQGSSNVPWGNAPTKN